MLHKCFWSWSWKSLKWQECRICDEKLWNTMDNLKKRGLRSCITKPPSSRHTFSDIFAWSESFSLHPQKKLSLITDLLIHSSFTSLLAMDSNSSPENILSSGGNMRIFVRGNPDSFKENVSWQQESLSLFWSSHWFAYMSSKLRFPTRMPRRGRVILDYFDPNKQTNKKCTGSAGR